MLTSLKTIARKYKHLNLAAFSTQNIKVLKYAHWYLDFWYLGI